MRGVMKAFGKKSEGLRRERMQASPLWTAAGFCKLHPVLPSLRDTGVPRPTLGEFLRGGQRRTPQGPLPSLNPLALAWPLD